jgi:hypothetical protein
LSKSIGAGLKPAPTDNLVYEGDYPSSPFPLSLTPQMVSMTKRVTT